MHIVIRYVDHTMPTPLMGRGSPHALNADTLATKVSSSWTPELMGMRFPAHPKFEPDGHLWNFGTMMGKLVTITSPQN